MSPLLSSGDFVFGIKYTFLKPKKDHIVVFNHKEYGTCIKKVTDFKGDKLSVTGINLKESLSEKQMGQIDLKRVKCRVLYIFKKSLS